MTQAYSEPHSAEDVLIQLDAMPEDEQIKSAFRWVSTYGDAATASEQICSAWDTRSMSVLIARIAFLSSPEFATVGAAEDEPRRIIERSLLGAVGSAAEPFGKHKLEAADGGEFPTWPTGCYSLDMDVRGGYGLSAILGEPSVGKSFLGISSAVEAARHGWTVCHFDAELGHRERLNRLLRYCDSFDDVLRENLHLFTVSTGATPALMLKEIKRVLTPDIKRLLIVGDSLNRITNLSAVGMHSNDYWNRFQSWVEFGRVAVRESEGLISFCWVGELNKAGRDKGEQLGYAANYIVSIKEGDAEDLVEITNVKSRDSKRADTMTYRRDWKRGRFVFEDVE